LWTVKQEKRKKDYQNRKDKSRRIRCPNRNSPGQGSSRILNRVPNISRRIIRVLRSLLIRLRSSPAAIPVSDARLPYFMQEKELTLRSFICPRSRLTLRRRPGRSKT